MALCPLEGLGWGGHAQASVCNTACQLLGGPYLPTGPESRVALLFMMELRGTCQGLEWAGRCTAWTAN